MNATILRTVDAARANRTSTIAHLVPREKVSRQDASAICGAVSAAWLMEVGTFNLCLVCAAAAVDGGDL